MMFLLQRGSSLQVFVDLYHGFFFLTKLNINLNQNMHRPNRHRGSNMTIFEDFGVHSSLFINVYFMFWTYWNFRIRHFVKHIYRLEQRFDSNVIHISCFASVSCASYIRILPALFAHNLLSASESLTVVQLLEWFPWKYNF